MAWSNKNQYSILVGAVLAALVAWWSQSWLFSQSSKASLVSPALPKFNLTSQTPICITLAQTLPECVFSDQHPAYQASIDSFWSSNARELKPGCIVRPLSVQDVSSAVKVLKHEYELSRNTTQPLRFALRSGGHSPEAGFGSIENGVAIDMSAFDTVSVAEDKQTTTIGAGARWKHVSAVLDPMGLAIVGGRSADTGVGGLVLGGGISFFSPRFGMVCDNILEYELVLADGSVLQVNETSHPDLWRALKGGTANFGILTQVTVKTFVSAKIFSGYLYFPSWSTPKVIKAFYSFNKPENFDKHAAGPIVASSYVSDLGIRAIGVNLAYTKPESWPAVYAGFTSLWRLWSTMKIQTLGQATKELSDLVPSGMRQFQVTTSVKNDLDTLNALHEYFEESVAKIRQVRGTVWSLVYQPLSAAVTRKGSPNVLGLETRHINDTIVIVLMSMSWKDAKDDEIVFSEARKVIARGEEFAAQRNALDPYRYLNYAASRQEPILGYGKENVAFLQDVSRRYDPSGFFQHAKQGHFKLHM